MKSKLKIKLARPIVFFDLETTGLNVATDRIVSISCYKILPDGQTEGKSAIVNPTIPIPKEASDVHGITNEMVKDKPLFKQIAKSLADFMKGCDIAGFNNNSYDNVLLCEEFGRCGIDFPSGDTMSVDVCTIFKKMEQRTLSAAYKYYCGKNLEDAHSSIADTLASFEVFVEQVKKYDELKGKSIQEIAEFCKTDNRVDLAGRIVKVNGEYLYNFGKHKNQKVLDNPSYAEWMISQDFPSNTKAVLKQILTDAGVLKNDNPF
jgi:DNA polymerase-3 subunit epsilon